MITVLADDLTSALDGAAPFAARGMRARVMLKIPENMPDDVDVLSFDLDSRFLSGTDAKERFKAAGKCVRSASLIYKTVDSTLRGNPGFETAGLMEGSGRERAIVAPAFPDAGRTTALGYQYVNDIPLELTEFARDPRTPITTGDVACRMDGLGHHQFTVFDAVCREEIENVVTTTGLRAPVIWVGSPGIAAALASAVPARMADVYKAMTPASKVLVVIGSLHPVNQQQLERLLQEGATAILMSEQPDVEGVAHQVSQAFLNRSVVCLVSERAPAATESCDLSPAEFLGRAVSASAGSYNALVVTGGDTARRIVDALDAVSMDLRGEAEPGVPFGILNLPEKSLPFATKAGGFGLAGTLLHCVRVLISAEEKELPND